MSGDDESNLSTLSKIRQFGLYRTVDARTEEFLKLSRRRQIKQGCACAAISTAVTVTIVIIILLTYEYVAAENDPKDKDASKEYWKSLLNNTRKTHLNDKHKVKRVELEKEKIRVKIMKHNEILEKLIKNATNNTHDKFSENKWLPLTKVNVYSIQYKISPVFLMNKIKGSKKNLDQIIKSKKAKEDQRIRDYFYKMIKSKAINKKRNIDYTNQYVGIGDGSGFINNIRIATSLNRENNNIANTIFTGNRKSGINTSIFNKFSNNFIENNKVNIWESDIDESTDDYDDSREASSYKPVKKHMKKKPINWLINKINKPVTTTEYIFKTSTTQPKENENSSGTTTIKGQLNTPIETTEGFDSLTSYKKELIKKVLTKIESANSNLSQYAKKIQPEFKFPSYSTHTEIINHKMLDKTSMIENSTEANFNNLLKQYCDTYVNKFPTEIYNASINKIHSSQNFNQTTKTLNTTIEVPKIDFIKISNKSDHLQLIINYTYGLINISLPHENIYASNNVDVESNLVNNSNKNKNENNSITLILHNITRLNVQMNNFIGNSSKIINITYPQEENSEYETTTYNIYNELINKLFSEITNNNYEVDKHLKRNISSTTIHIVNTTPTEPNFTEDKSIIGSNKDIEDHFSFKDNNPLLEQETSTKYTIYNLIKSILDRTSSNYENMDFYTDKMENETSTQITNTVQNNSKNYQNIDLSTRATKTKLLTNTTYNIIKTLHKNSSNEYKKGDHKIIAIEHKTMHEKTSNNSISQDRKTHKMQLEASTLRINNIVKTLPKNTLNSYESLQLKEIETSTINLNKSLFETTSYNYETQKDNTYAMKYEISTRKVNNTVKALLEKLSHNFKTNELSTRLIEQETSTYKSYFSTSFEEKSSNYYNTENITHHTDNDNREKNKSSIVATIKNNLIKSILKKIAINNENNTRIDVLKLTPNHNMSQTKLKNDTKTFKESNKIHDDKISKPKLNVTKVRGEYTKKNLNEYYTGIYDNLEQYTVLDNVIETTHNSTVTEKVLLSTLEQTNNKYKEVPSINFDDYTTPTINIEQENSANKINMKSKIIYPNYYVNEFINNTEQTTESSMINFYDTTSKYKHVLTKPTVDNFDKALYNIAKKYFYKLRNNVRTTEIIDAEVHNNNNLDKNNNGYETNKYLFSNMNEHDASTHNIKQDDNNVKYYTDSDLYQAYKYIQIDVNKFKTNNNKTNKYEYTNPLNEKKTTSHFDDGKLMSNYIVKYNKETPVYMFEYNNKDFLTKPLPYDQNTYTYIEQSTSYISNNDYFNMFSYKKPSYLNIQRYLS